MKLDALANLEGNRQAVARRCPALCHVADDLRIVLRIESQQGAVMRCHRMKHTERRFTVSIVRRRRFADRKDQLPARPRRFSGDRRPVERKHQPESDNPKYKTESRQSVNPSSHLCDLVSLFHLDLRDRANMRDSAKQSQDRCLIAILTSRALDETPASTYS